MVTRIMREYDSLLFLWIMHAAIAAVLSAPIVFFGRRRVHWYSWEVLSLVLPFSVWLLLMFSDLSLGKSIANFGESLLISLAVPAAALVRVAIGHRAVERSIAIAIIAALCVIAASAFFIVPPLPE